MNEDTDHPTICGTGTEDYFCGSYDLGDPVSHERYVPFTTPYPGTSGTDTGYPSIEASSALACIGDILRKKLKVTIQKLGWREGGRYLLLKDDSASVAYWYQT